MPLDSIRAGGAFVRAHGRRPEKRREKRKLITSCVSCELVCVCVSLVRAVIICPASTHTALVSSPSLAVLHLSTYLPT